LLAKAVCQSLKRVTDPPPSRASPLPHLACVPRLESDFNVVETGVETPLISSPNTDQNCGSGLARESGLPVAERVTDPPPSRASPLPHLACIPRLVWGCTTRSNAAAAPRPPARTPIKTVGAGLLAKGSCQSLRRVADPPPSRASPLPHLACVPRLESGCTTRSCRCSTSASTPNTNQNCGSGLARESGFPVAEKGG